MTFRVPFMLDVNLMKHCGMRGLVDKRRVEADGGALCAAVCAAVAQGGNTHVLALIFLSKMFHLEFTALAKIYIWRSLARLPKYKLPLCSADSQPG